MGQVMPRAANAVRGPGGLDGVQRVADRAVAERVEVNLEPFTVQRGDEPGQLGRVDEIQPGVPGGTAVRVQVRLQHRRGVGLDHPVQHHLHASGAEKPGL